MRETGASIADIKICGCECCRICNIVKRQEWSSPFRRRGVPRSKHEQNYQGEPDDLLVAQIDFYNDPYLHGLALADTVIAALQRPC